MKVAVALVLVLITSGAQAGENLVCALMKNSDKSKLVSVKVDLTKPLEDAYYPEDSIDVGDNSYSFVLEATQEKKQLSLVVTFQDSNDEVGQSVFEVDLSKSKKGKPVVTEPITDTEGNNSMIFICYHNKK